MHMICCSTAKTMTLFQINKGVELSVSTFLEIPNACQARITEHPLGRTVFEV